MSAHSSSNQARADWITLINGSLARLREVYDFDNTVSSEGTFREQFNRLPDDLNGPNADRNYNRLNRSHGQMLSIVRGLDRALLLSPPESLTDVFWTYILAGLQIPMNKLGINYASLSDLHLKLNSRDAIPPISSDLPQFPRDPSVQRPLQKIFRTYIDCYYVFIKQYAQATDHVEIQPILDTITTASTEYATSESEWRDRIQEVKDEQSDYAKKQSQSADDQHRDSRFEHVRDLGKGTYGFVDEVREATTGSVYARKSIPVRISGQDADAIQKRVENEVDIMSKKLRHNHIASVNIYFKGDQYWSMIMLPVADYDLRAFLDKTTDDGFPADSLRMIDPWFGCLISALSYAHSERIKHEDIKPTNILIKDRKVYLTDFGTAKDFTGEASTVSDYAITGTPIYWAPEPRIWGRAADVFALGCVFSEMLTVRQKRSLADYRKFRHTASAEWAVAYRTSLPKVKRWLKELDGIDPRDPAAQTILEQTLNMLMENHHDRLEAGRLKRNFRIDDSLFCDTCY